MPDKLTKTKYDGIFLNEKTGTYYLIKMLNGKYFRRSLKHQIYRRIIKFNVRTIIINSNHKTGIKNNYIETKKITNT